MKQNHKVLIWKHQPSQSIKVSRVEVCGLKWDFYRKCYLINTDKKLEVRGGELRVYRDRVRHKCIYKLFVKLSRFSELPRKFEFWRRTHLLAVEIMF
jgi:tryptophan 2,3-dioxygenase